MGKKIVFDDKARDAIKEGVVKLAKAVKSTLGPKGRNVIIQKAYADPVITKDGVSVARSIEFDDAMENMGASLVKTVAAKTSDDAGDGTTTATVLTEAIYVEGLRKLAAGCDPMAVNRGITKAVDAISAKLDAQSQEVVTPQKIKQVATIASNNDTEIGGMIADALGKVGLDGVITVEETRSLKTTVDIVEGLNFPKGYISPYFVTDRETMECTYMNPLIMVTDQKISNIQDILPMLEAVSGNKKPLIIIADDVDADVLATMVVNYTRGVFKLAVVKAPGYGDGRKKLLSDIAVVTGATFISRDLGLKIAETHLGHFGSAKKIKITKDETTIMEGIGNPEEVKTHIEGLQADIDRTESDFVKDKLRERLATLKGGVARINVGASSDTELKERKGRIEDALSATRAAVEAGILPGGGTALARIANGLIVETDDGDELIGVEIIKRAASAPLRQIAENAGITGDVVLAKVLDEEAENFGYNARTGEYGDLVELGVIDPSKVTKTALQNAASVAGVLLTTNCIVSETPDPAAAANPLGALPPGIM